MLNLQFHLQFALLCQIRGRARAGANCFDGVEKCTLAVDVMRDVALVLLTALAGGFFGEMVFLLLWLLRIEMMLGWGWTASVCEIPRCDGS